MYVLHAGDGDLVKIGKVHDNAHDGLASRMKGLQASMPVKLCAVPNAVPCPRMSPR